MKTHLISSYLILIKKTIVPHPFIPELFCRSFGFGVIPEVQVYAPYTDSILPISTIYKPHHYLAAKLACSDY